MSEGLGDDQTGRTRTRPIPGVLPALVWMAVYCIGATILIVFPSSIPRELLTDQDLRSAVTTVFRRSTLAIQLISYPLFLYGIWKSTAYVKSYSGRWIGGLATGLRLVSITLVLSFIPYHVLMEIFWQDTDANRYYILPCFVIGSFLNTSGILITILSLTIAASFYWHSGEKLLMTLSVASVISIITAFLIFKYIPALSGVYYRFVMSAGLELIPWIAATSRLVYFFAFSILVFLVRVPASSIQGAGNDVTNADN